VAKLFVVSTWSLILTLQRDASGLSSNKPVCMEADKVTAEKPRRGRVRDSATIAKKKDKQSKRQVLPRDKQGTVWQAKRELR
jgi:hypothetical protein